MARDKQHRSGGRPTAKITLTEGLKGEIHMVTAFDPPIPKDLDPQELEEFLAKYPTHETIVALAGAAGDWLTEE